MNTLTERFGWWLLRSIAAVMMFAGAAVLVAGLAATSMPVGSAALSAIGGILFQMGALFVVLGGVAIVLSRPHGRLSLPNERAETTEAGRPELGGWLIVLAVALVALPVWLVLRLLPFLAEWRRVADFLAASRWWDGANANGAGLVVVPIAGALVPPLLELIALAGFVAASAALLRLLLTRSPRFPRVYIVCVVLLSALVIASVRGAGAAAVARTAVERLMEDTKSRGDEDVQVRQGLDRYSSAVNTAASALLWTSGGYLIWMPAMFLSRRVRTTFARRSGRDDSTPASASGVEAITSPPRWPG
jgi:hypothetical protein